MRTTTRGVGVVLVALLSTALFAIPGEAAEQAPLLWQGQVLGADGEPTEAEVVAALRPPPAALPTAEEFAAGQTGPQPLVLATTRSDSDGRFELRSSIPDVPAEYRSGGWVHVVLTVQRPDGTWALAFDSVRVGSRGRWMSTAGETDTSEDLTDQRPEVIQLADPWPGSDEAGFGAHAVGPGKPWAGCTPLFVEDRMDAHRTIADIDVERDWTFELHYQETDSTAWQVGYEKSGGNWAAGGSASFDSERGAGFDSAFGPYPERFREHFQVQLTHAKIKWRCGNHSSPGPFYVSTVEPEQWTGGTYNRGDPEVTCGRDFTPVAGNTVQWRSEGSSSKYSASGGAFGFSGTASVKYSKGIRLGWRNHRQNPRLLCGEVGDPIKDDTRVRAIDF